MLTEEKIKSFAEKYSDRSGEFVISTLNHVMDYEAERGYELFDFTKDDFVKMFAKYNWVNSSRSFRNVKSIITGYIKSEDRASMYDLAEFSESDVSSDNMYEDKYFESVDEFVDFLDKYEEPYQIRMNVIHGSHGDASPPLPSTSCFCGTSEMRRKSGSTVRRGRGADRAVTVPSGRNHG